MATQLTKNGLQSVPNKGGIVYRPGEGFVSTPDVRREVVNTIIPVYNHISSGGSSSGGGSATPTIQYSEPIGPQQQADASFTSQGSTYNPATESSSINRPQALNNMNMAQATTYGTDMTPQQYENMNKPQLSKPNQANTNVTSIGGGIRQDFKNLFSNKIDLVPDSTFYAFTSTIDTGLNTYVRPVLGERGQAVYDFINFKMDDPLRKVLIPMAFGSILSTSTSGIRSGTITVKTNPVIEPVNFKGVVNIQSENSANVILGGKSGKQTFFSEQNLKLMGDKSIGIEKGFKITKPDKFTTDVTLFRGGGGASEIGTGSRYTKVYGTTVEDDLLTGLYKAQITKGTGTAVKSSSVTQDIGGLRYQRNLVNQLKVSKFGVDTTPIKTNAVGILEETSNPNVFRYSGTTDNVLRIYKGGTPKIAGKVNIQGLVKVNYPTSSTGEVFNIPNTVNTKSVSTLVSKSVSPFVSPQSTATTSAIKFTSPITGSAVKTGSIFAGQGLYEQTSGGQLPKFTMTGMSIMNQNNNNFLATTPVYGMSYSTDTGVKTSTSTTPVLKSVSPTKLITPTRTTQTQTPLLDQPQVQTPIADTTQRFRTSITPNIKIPNLGTPTTGTPFIPPFTLPSFDAGKTKNRKYKGKQRYKYTPDFGSIVLGRYGKAPKGRLTGLEVRPLTKGFNWGYSKSRNNNFIGNIGGLFSKRKRKKKWLF